MKKIYQIKKRREDKALSNVQKKKSAVKKARQILDAKQKELIDHRNYRIQQEKELFQEVVSRSLKTKELAIYNHKVTKLRKNEAKIKESIERARQELSNAVDAEKEAVRHYNQAVRDSRKIEEFNKVVEEQRLKDENRKTEKELEDAPYRRKNVTVESV